MTSVGGCHVLGLSGGQNLCDRNAGFAAKSVDNAPSARL